MSYMTSMTSYFSLHYAHRHITNYFCSLFGLSSNSSLPSFQM